jgi:hypothetical protein
MKVIWNNTVLAQSLGVHRMFEPERAVLVKGRDSLFGRHILRAFLARVTRTNSKIAFFGTPSSQDGGGSVCWANACA